MNIIKVSQLSGRVNNREIDITQEQYTEYCEGNELVQKLFPTLSADDREFLISGNTPEEWEDAFGTED